MANLSPKNTASWLNDTRVIYASLLVCLGYWVTLAVASSMMIIYDAQNYRDLGVLLFKDGWGEYFQSGPHREPLFPLLVSTAMRLGQFLPWPFLKIQTILHILILLVTQGLMIVLLRKLRVRPLITAGTVLYFGISPAVINSAFSLYSEIATYPIVLLIILVSLRCWENIFQGTTARAIGWGCVLAACFFLITMVKAIFEFITPLSLLLFAYLIMKLIVHRRHVEARRAIALTAAVLLAYFALALGYKQLNLKGNGRFAITDRGSWAVYGNTARRLEPMTARRVAAAIAYTPGEKLCWSVFGKPECTFWSAEKSDDMGMTMQMEFTDRGIKGQDVDRLLLLFNKSKFTENPGQYIFFWILEGGKMFFWESTKIGWVEYPSWLEKIYDQRLFNNLLRFLTALLSFAGVVYAWARVLRNRRKIFPGYNLQDERFVLLLLIINLIVIYISLYSFFFVLTRYTFPLVPLYLVLAAFTLQEISSKRINRQQ